MAFVMPWYSKSLKRTLEHYRTLEEVSEKPQMHPFGVNFS